MTEENVNLLPLVHRQDISTPEAVLEQALPKVIEVTPNATCAQVYRLAHGGMVVWYSADGDAVLGKFYPMEEGSPYQQTATSGEPTIDEDHNLLIAPLRGRYETIFGLLTVECSEPPTDNHVLDASAAQLSSTLYSKQLEQLLHRQVALTSQFNQAESLEQIASIFAINSIVQSQFVAINIFDYAADGTLEGATAVVTANRAETFQTDDPVAVNLTYIQIVHDGLLNQGDFLVSNAETDERFTKEDRAWLQSRHLHSVYCLPLHIQNTLYGFITIIDTVNALAPTPLEKQIYHNIAEQAATIIEKRRLLQQTQEQTRVLSLLSDLMQRANAEQDETILLQDTAQVLHTATGLGHVGIGLIDDSGTFNHIVAEYPDAGSVGKQVEARGGGIPDLLIKSRRALIISDIANDTTLLPLSRESLTELGVKSAMFLPMFDLDGKLFGTVGLDSYVQVDEFSQQTIEAAETIVSQIAVNLQKLRLLQNSQAQAAQLQQIAEFGQAMQASLQLEEILNTVLTYSRNIVSGDYVSVMIYDRHIESLRMSAQFWQDEGQTTLPGMPITKASNSIAEQAWEKRHLIHVDVLQAGWEWEHPLVASLHSMMVAPLIAGGVLLGILEVGSLQDGAYSPTDVAAFRQMTNQLAVAIANAETYSQSQRLARNKVKANEIIASLQQQADVTSILHVTAQELGKALGAKRARIRLGLNMQEPSGD